MMASPLKWLGRAVFSALITTQCYFFAAYPADYEDNSLWFLAVFTFVPAVILWIHLLASKAANLRWFFYVWALYIICALIPNITIIFGVVGDKLDKKRFFGPNTLKAVLCLTPPILLLLLHTADDSDQTEEHKDAVSKLSFQMAIDLFDVIDMIDLILDEQGGHGFRALSNSTANTTDTPFPQPRSHMKTTEASILQMHIGFKIFERGMVAVACFSLLLSIWQLAENKFNNNGAKFRYRTAVVRNIVEIVCVNLIFLVIRAVVFFEFGVDESIFMAKNAISIILSIFEIYHLCDSHNTSLWSLCTRCFGLTNH